MLWALPGEMMGPTTGVRERGRATRHRAGVRTVPSYRIEHPKGLVLFDAGLSPKGLEDPLAYFGIMAQLYQWSSLRNSPSTRSCASSALPSRTSRTSCPHISTSITRAVSNCCPT